jgi:adenine-specific DNA-methyltransferase
MAKKQPKPKKVDSLRHKDKRVNIPTEELRDFVRKEEQAPKSMLYPRDPSLDPQLVWKGKDEQDQRDLEVPVVPIYIQEKIHPQALIENLRAASKPKAKTGDPEQINLFADFNGIDDFEKKVDFYQHEANWANRMILGDSLLVMTSLAEKEGLKGKVQMIYLDPPYGIKFGSNWQVSTRKRDVKDGKADHLTRQPEQIRAFRDTWKFGIHSYLSYLRDRLTLARELLTDTGSVFVQIGDENVHLTRSVLDEVFGSENFLSLITFKKTSGAGSFAGGTNVLASTNDYVLWFAKDIARVKYRQLYRAKEIAGPGGEAYTWVEEPSAGRRRASAEELETGTTTGRFFRPSPLTSETVREAQTTVFEVRLNGKSFWPKKGGWKTNRSGMDRLKTANRLMAAGVSLNYVRYFDDFPAFPLTNLWNDTQSGSGMDKVYVVQTNSKVVERCLLMTTDPGDLVLDPTCGSGTSALVSEQWGRRWITFDTSRVALSLARTRLIAARFAYYFLADSEDGIDKEAEISHKLPPPHNPTNDVRKGFVYRRVPHVTLKSIANNPDIEEGVPQDKLDEAIVRYADQELLYDQPYSDTSRIRVTGPFTVESLSPHRVLPANDPEPLSEAEGRADTRQDFTSMILENLKAAGVQNTRKKERLKFDTLEPIAGISIHAAGQYTDAEGKTRRAAISLGPEHGTVSPQQIKEAAKEAVQGLGYDILIVCGFAFDPHVSEEAKRYGNLTVLITRMNYDLAMGGDLLKKTGSGNLFTVFGEPELKIETQKDGQIVVEILGVDVYDPTTGDIRSSSTDDIACWFIDTEYNGESFFVRHAYFTGADEPYEKLKRALRADIDEEAWATLYQTKSRPFPKPKSNKIAVKVINHYGDEVLKVYNL